MCAIDIFVYLYRILAFGFLLEQFFKSYMIVFSFSFRPLSFPRTRLPAKTTLLSQFDAIEPAKEVEFVPIESRFDRLVLDAFSYDTLSAPSWGKIQFDFSMRLLDLNLLLLLSLSQGRAVAYFLFYC